jgi:hypothetical protein
MDNHYDISRLIATSKMVKRKPFVRVVGLAAFRETRLGEMDRRQAGLLEFQKGGLPATGGAAWK